MAKHRKKRLEKLKRLNMSYRQMLIGGIIVTLLVLIGIFALLNSPDSQPGEPQPTPDELTVEESEIIKNSVAKLIVLPDEEPTIATIVDIDTLREENTDFYANAQNGDALLIFSSFAIIYRPADNLLVKVAELPVGK